MIKRFLSILLCFCLILGMMPGFIMTAYASAVPNGTYEVPNTGGNIHFTISGNTLTVSGTGDIPDRTPETAGNILGTEYVTATSGTTITKIVVENGITRLGNFAFAGFNNVTEITIPESVTTIGMYAFWGVGITSLQLPSRLSIIDTLAIVDCPNLTTIIFGNDSTDTALTTVRYRFVSDCPSLNLIRFSPSMSSILPGALSDVENNTGLCVEAYMKYRGAIGYNTDGLKGLPDGVVKNYYELALQNNGTTIDVNPAKNTSAFYTGYYAAGDTVSLTVTPDPGYTLTPVSSYRQGALSPSSGTTYALTMASREDCIMATAIDPGASGTEVASGTMSNNSNITWRVIQVDGGYKLCFSGSGELSVSDDPPWKAAYKDNILSVEMGEGITKISTASIVGGGAFYNYANLKEVVFSSSLTEIGGNAFNLTDALESVTLSSGVKIVGAYAFRNCYKIKKVTLNEGLTSIGEGAFAVAFSDSGVTSATVIIPSTVTSIGANAFLNNGKLTVFNCSSANLSLSQPTVYFCVPVTTTVVGGSVTLSIPASGYKNYYYYGNDIGSNAENVTISAPSSKLITSVKRGGTELLAEGTEASSYTYTVVNGSNALDITLEATPHNITYSPAGGGTISGVATARAGDIVTVTATPESGFACTGIYLKIGSSDVDIAVSGNSFEMPDDDVTISATFAAMLKLTGTLTATGTYGQVLSTLLPALAESSKVETESGTEVVGTWSFDATQSLDGQSTAASGIFPAVGGITGYTATFTPFANPQNYANTLTATVVPVMSYLSTDAVAALEGMKAVGSDWYISDVTLTAPDGFRIAPAIDGTYGTSLTVSSDMEGSYTYYLKETITGYITDKKTIAIKRDATAPDIGTLAYSEHLSFLDWLLHKESIIVTVPVTDATSGAKKISYVLTPDGGSAQEEQTTDVDSNGNAAFTIPKIFKGTVVVKAYDIAGNTTTEVTTKKLMVEDTAPTMTITDGTSAFTENWYTTVQTVHITVSDADCGLKSITYTVDGGSLQTLFEASESDGSLTAAKDLTLVAQEGTHTYSVTVTDNALNAKTTAVTVKQDSIQPTVSIVEASAVTQETATVTVTAPDVNSGVISYLLTCTTGSLPEQNNATGVFQLTGLQPNTNYAFTATVTDNAGNVSAGSSVSFKTEKNIPVVTIEPSFAGAVYGARLSELTINQGASNVTGTWELDETGADGIYPTVGGTTTYTVKFVPADNTFDTLTRELTPVITPKALSVTGAAATGRKYDGTKQVSITAVTLDGVINSDNIRVDTANLTGTLSAADVGNYDSATLPTLTLTGTAVGNYTLTQPTEPVSVSVSIEKADPLSLTGSATMVKNHANYTIELDLTQTSGYPSAPGGMPAFAVTSGTSLYNGLTSATIDASGKLTLVADNTANSTTETVTVSVTGMGNYADSIITVSVNYTDKTPVTITGLSAPTSRVYNGSAVANADFGTPVLTPNSYTGENLTYTYYSGSSPSGATISAPKDAGTYTVRIAVLGTDETYEGHSDITFTIDKAIVTTTADNKSMNRGGTPPTFTVSYTGIAIGETAKSIFTTQAIASCEADGNTAGSYPIIVTTPVMTEAAANNYTVAAPVSGTLTVNNPSTGGGNGGGLDTTSDSNSVSYTLSFETNGGSAIDKLSKTSGTTVDLSGYVPTREGYEFAGWYSDESLATKVTSTMLTKNTTVYAKWTKNKVQSTNPFTDVSGNAYYRDAVLWAVEKNITSGTTSTTFSPDMICTRAQMVTFLWKAEGSPEPNSADCPFTDVAQNAYYYKAVLWTVEKGITAGTSATTFGSDDIVTRGQAVTFMWHAAGKPETTSTNPFTDVSADAYYCYAVLWAAETGITQGTSAVSFSPVAPCTRSQIVTFLYRYMVE